MEAVKKSKVTRGLGRREETGRTQRALKLFCRILNWDMHYIFVKFRECTPPRVNCNVGAWILLNSRVYGVRMLREAVHVCVGRAVKGKTMYFLINFCYATKTAVKNNVYLTKQTSSVKTCKYYKQGKIVLLRWGPGINFSDPLI